MSDLSEKVRTALYGRLSALAVELVYNAVNLTYGGQELAYGTVEATNVYYGKAPENAVYPFLEFQRVPGVVDYTFQNNRTGERDRWFIRAFCDEDGASGASPAATNEALLTAALTAIGNSLTLSGATAHRVTRVADIPEIVENVNDRLVWMNGFQLEVYAG